ncbi:MAG: hypothetical protein QXT33_07460 [Thermofilum sp.]
MSERMKSEKFATLVSLALSPQIYGGVVAYLLWREVRVGGVEAVAVLLLTQTFLPLAPILVDTARRRIDIFVSDRRVRLKYYVLTIASYALGAALCTLKNWYVYIPSFAAYAASAALLAVVNELAKWKISAHTAGITGPTTLLVYACGNHYTPLYLLVIPVFWARLRLGAHTVGQLVAGAITAAAMTAAVLSVWLQ